MGYTIVHVSVLKQEVISYLMQDTGIYVDATFGAGGHTRAILDSDPFCKVLGIDWDKDSLDQFGMLIHNDFTDRFIPVWGSFAHLYKLLNTQQKGSIKGILADFGTSFMQIHEKDGFSFGIDTPLDMRMSASHFGQTAADFVNSLSEYELAQLIWDYGQDRYSRVIAKAIVQARKKKRFSTTGQLVQVILSVCPWKKDTKIHPATRTFQALRIRVNNELENIKSFLKGAYDVLLPGGRIVCISFHSLEDELVKRFFKDYEQLGHGTVITKKPVTPSDDELKQNRASRSAKLRVFQKKA
ncbi:16S rRNA (cytosine(1402)-N(4))-methyltransferase RsmH [bacterium]|nr:MAG: 16S rRNA (cytosine(1402)-N(4))-methyltransferase RsmH [bacterium]QQR61555.1 MAG: 16S rRNA (cytosine(1402)-N(4))-methyltransferase RsmH [bacterium]QQR62911.1 MAG: 16S rRNA (cytosine(1402)-N(4))-methyltransferase RsmH [bacterium]